VVYDELHRMAEQKLSGDVRNQTLQPTALVHDSDFYSPLGEMVPVGTDEGSGPRICGLDVSQRGSPDLQHLRDGTGGDVRHGPGHCDKVHSARLASPKKISVSWPFFAGPFACVIEDSMAGRD